MPRPFCFVLMPFGQKSDSQGRVIDFDDVYASLIRPAVEAAEFDPIRAVEDLAGGIIHKTMLEQLILCPFAIIDLSLAESSVFYELGVRHALRPYQTVSVIAEGLQMPSAVSLLGAVSYPLPMKEQSAALDSSRLAITTALQSVGRDDRQASPLLQLADEFSWREQIDQLPHEKTDAFRDQVRYSERLKEELAQARATGLDELKRVEDLIRAEAGSIENAEVGVALDLFLSFRAVKAWGDMIRLADEMAPPIRRVVMVREQLALALNRRAGELAKEGSEKEARTIRDRAIEVLEELIQTRGPNGETNGILGRVYKDSWEEARDAGNETAAQSWLEKAIEAYLAGFESDWRDAYPGVNTVTLMELADPPDERRQLLIPVVAYAVERKIAAKQPDYWDFATRLELAVLEKNPQAARSAICKALEHQREVWEPETTARNLRLIRQAREARGEEVAWQLSLEQELLAAAGP